MGRQFLFVSDFDQTLSFNDSGLVLSRLLNVDGFEDRVAGLSKIHLVQQGGELAYLLMHDPEFRRVRKEHLIATGKQIRLKSNIPMLASLLRDMNGDGFDFHVVSAAPQEVIQSALEGVVPEDHIHGTRFQYADSGEIRTVVRLPAGYGKVAVVDALRSELKVGGDRVVYVGDGSSDVHVMLHVNRQEGFTIAVSENRYLTPIARRTILSDDACSVLVALLEDVYGWSPAKVRMFFESNGLALQDWEKVRTDLITVSSTTPDDAASVN